MVNPEVFLQDYLELVVDVYMNYRSQRRNHDVVLETLDVEANAAAH